MRTKATRGDAFSVNVPQGSSTVAKNQTVDPFVLLVAAPSYDLAVSTANGRAAAVPALSRAPRTTSPSR